MEVLDSQLFAAVVGAVIGAGSAVVGTLSIERRRDNRQACSARAMLKIEIASNVRDLQTLHKIIPVDPEIENDSSIQTRMYKIATTPEEAGKTLMLYPLGHWATTTWISQNALWPSILSIEEIQTVAEFYTALSDISTIREELFRARQSDDAYRLAPRQTKSSIIGGQNRAGWLTADLNPPIAHRIANALSKGREIEERLSQSKHSGALTA